MKPAFGYVFCIGSVLLITAHRLLAPISEPTPEETKAKPQAAPAKHKSVESSDSNSARRFDGTWKATDSSRNQAGSTVNRTATIVIKNGVAEFTSEATATLDPGKTWSDLPEPYNSSSPIYKKWTARSTDLKFEGSNLKIRWLGTRLTDWAPKTIPVGVFKNPVDQPHSALYILSGQQLIVTNGKQSATYTRVR
jgi:hypothetical protein